MNRFELASSVEDFSSERHKELYEYWLKLKADKALPSRADFNPMAVPAVLPMIMMFGVEGPPFRFKGRIAGAQVVDVSGINCTGIYVDQLPYTEGVSERLTQLLQNKEPYYVEAELTWAKKQYKLYSALVLPFSSDGEAVDIIISSHHYYPKSL